MKISFIIPAYNAENYIKKCIDSILNQGVDAGHFEIIIVNDGSVDSTDDICLQLQRQYPTIKYFNKKNSGPGDTRNFGIAKATGEYIWFVDADDYLVANVLPRIVMEIKEGLDLYMVGYQFVDKEGIQIKKQEYIEEVLTPKESLDKGQFINYVWCKIIRRVVLLDNDISFKKDISTAEDFHFSFKLLRAIQFLKTLDIIGYVYVQHPNSLMTSRSEKHMIKLAEDSVLIGRELRCIVNEIPEKQHRRGFNAWLSNYLFGLLFSLFRFNYSYSFVAHILNELKKDGNYPIKMYNTNWKRKLFIRASNLRFLFLASIWVKRKITK
tara:strand:+ start:5022 stop:5993 length:972 start_codon:yes stop_codon:yes gene_type:complete